MTLDKLNIVCYKKVMAKRLIPLLFFLFVFPTAVLADDASPTPSPWVVNNVNQSGGGINIANNNNNQNNNTNNNNININTGGVRSVAVVPRTLPATGADPSPAILAMLFGAIPLGLKLRRWGKTSL